MGVVLRRKERREDLVDGCEEEEMVVVNGGVEIGLVEEEAMAVGVCVFCVLGCGFSKGLCAQIGRAHV